MRFVVTCMYDRAVDLDVDGNAVLVEVFGVEAEGIGDVVEWAVSGELRWAGVVGFRIDKAEKPYEMNLPIEANLMNDAAGCEGG